MHRFRTFERGRDGRLVVRLLAAEVALLGMIASEVRTLISGSGENTVTERLFPRAYLDPTEEQAEATWRDAVGGDLRDEKVAALDGVCAAVAEPGSGDVVELRLDAEQEAHLLSALNDIRLALGAILQADDAGAAEGMHAKDVLDWLTGLESDLVYMLLDET